jgi:hypothetical protein
MNKIWDNVYSNSLSFFGEEPSNFALTCYEDFVKHKVKRIFELGCGQGRDSFLLQKD